MPQKNVFRRFTAPSILGGILLVQGHAHAQQDAQVRLVPNDQVIQSWQQSNLGGVAPALKPDDDGTTRLDWNGGVTVDAYSNDIQSAGGYANTALQSGSFYKTSLSSDLRIIHSDSAVVYFQLGGSSSDDRAVLSQNPYQINNVQVGRAGEGYHVAVGDIAPNFSSLSSALGVRGLYGQRQFGDMTVHGFSGQVAENWEVLSGTVPSNQYIRDVRGAKLEKAFGSSLQTYITAQTFSEREAPAMAQPGMAALGTSHSMSAGFQYQQDQFSLSAETAGSAFEDDGSSNRQGRATVVDANWLGESVGLHAGHHHIDGEFTSLSAAAQPGVHETYIGVDWMAAPWVTLSSDLRKSKNSTLATAYSEATSVDTDAFTVRATVNFGVDHPGWGLSLQNVEAQSTDAVAQVSRRSDFSATINYSTPDLMAGIGFGQGKISNEMSPFADSNTESWSFNVGRTFSDAPPDGAPTWSVGANFFASSQIQRLLMDGGGSSSNTNYTLALTGQLAGWGAVNLLLSGGETTQPSGAPSLRVRGVQLDAVFPMKGQDTFKVYVRTTQRNGDDPILFAQENVLGLQLIYNF